VIFRFVDLGETVYDLCLNILFVICSSVNMCQHRDMMLYFWRCGTTHIVYLGRIMLLCFSRDFLI